MIIIELIYNLAILVSLSVFSGFIGARFNRNSTTGKVLQGILFGITAIIGMLYPFVLSEGLFFDGRSIVISLCTLFFGPISGLIAAVMAVIFRTLIGGVGLTMGLLVISSSLLIGYFFHVRKVNSNTKNITNLQLYLLGFIVHVVMLLLIFVLPTAKMIAAYQTVGFTIIGVYPVITLLIGKILDDQESRQDLFEDLKKSETKFRALTEASPAAIFIYQDTKFVYLNESSSELTGYKTDELIDKEFWSIVHPDFQELIKTRGLSRQRGENIPTRYQFKIVRKNGEERWIDFSATLMNIDGKPAAMGTAYDITSTIESLDILQQQKDLFQTTIYSIGDGVIITDTDGLVQQMNHVAEQMTGYLESEAKGKLVGEIFKIVDENSHQKVKCPVEEVLKKNVIVEIANHTLLLSKDDRVIPIADSAAPIKGKDQKIIGVVLVFRDQSEEREAEKKIRESETKFRTLVENAFDGIYMMEDKHYVYVNERFCKITGYSKTELTSKDFDLNLLLTDSSKKIVEQRYLARKAGENIPVTYGFQLLTKKGDVKEVELSAVSIGTKENISVIGIIRDITDRKTAEEELQKAKERMQVLVEGTPHLFFYIQDTKGDVKYISPSVEKITGYSFTDWLGQHHWYTTDSPMNDEARRRTRANLKGEINYDPIITEIEHANGNKILLEIYEKPIFEGDRIVGLQGVAHDVTERNKAEERIKEINTRLQTAIEGADIGIWDQDFVKGEVLRMGRWGEMLGFKTEEINKKITTWKELIHPEDKEYVEKAIFEHDSGLTTEFKVEHRLRTIDGNYKYILNWGRVYERDENGKPLKASGIHLDIDERKRAELEIQRAKLQAERANQLKSEFLAQISHEIRSPLNAVLNFSQLLKEEFSDKMEDEIQISFDGIDSASKRVIRTIDLILNMSELQLGTYEVTHRKMDLVIMLSNIRKEYSNQARIKNLQLRFITELESAKITTDEYAVNQIFANLIDNAIKYTKKGYIEISIDKLKEDKYEIKVSDSGVGISKEFLPEIFEAFSQEEKGYSRQYEGSGLGLSLVKKYCDLIDAEIRIDSERGKGTTFVVTLDS